MWTAKDITVVSICFGDRYWQEYRGQFFEQIRAASPRAKAILVTDVPRETPDWVEQHTFTGHMYAMYQHAIQYVDTAWVWGVGFDDLILPGAFEDWESDADILGHPEHMFGATSDDCSYLGGYEDMWRHGGPNPMLGSFWTRTALMREIPWREHDFADWSFFAECAYFGKRLEMSDRFVASWNRHEGSASSVFNPTGLIQVQEFLGHLREGRVPHAGAAVLESVPSP